MKASGVLLALALVGCGNAANKSGDETESSAASSSKSKSKHAASAKPSAVPSAASSAAPSAAATPAAPATLGEMFDGESDPAVKMSESKTVGRASIDLPDGWKAGASWDSVDSFANADGTARVVLLRLDISEGLLDTNLATWVKVPFVTTEVKWEPREPGKLGRAHLEAQVAKGSGKIGPDDADFFHVATAIDKKHYGLVVIAGVKKSADDKTRSELRAVVRSVQWK